MAENENNDILVDCSAIKNFKKINCSAVENRSYRTRFRNLLYKNLNEESFMTLLNYKKFSINDFLVDCNKYTETYPNNICVSMIYNIVNNSCHNNYDNS